jgi:RNA polymerase sigma factor (sigma-70 family)
MNDWELLQKWVQQRSDVAFGELVNRHLNLVYASALRQVREPELARDVSQAVFLALAQKAHRLSSKVILSGWLFRTTGFVAARAVRSEMRRKRWETEASSMNPLITDSMNPAETWPVVQNHLDSALQSLSAQDRDALLVRFFEQQPLRSVAERFGITDEAAKKRVSRAVEKLRSILTRRGVTLSSAAVGTLLMSVPSEAAPAGLASVITHAAAHGAVSTSVGTLASEALRDLFLAKLAQLSPIPIAVLLFLIAATLWWRSESKINPGFTAQNPAASLEANAPVPARLQSSPDSAPKPGPSRILLSVQSASDNAPVVATLRASGSFRGSGADPWSSTPTLQITTDANGQAEIPVDGSKVNHFHISLSAPGYVPVSLSWQGHEFVEPVLYYTARLERGNTLQGIVQNEQGVPVSNARITFNGPGIDMGERQNIGFNNRLTGLRTDDQGRFHTDQIPALVGDHVMSYAVEHDDYVRETVNLNNSATLQTNHLVILKSGLKVRGTVIDASGHPIAGTKITEDHNFAGPHRNSESDRNGAFEIGPFLPNESVFIAASASGFAENKIPVNISSSATNAIIQLAVASGEKNDWERGMDSGITMRLTGTVIDETSRQPIDLFRVRLDEHRGTDLHLLGDGHNGHFDWPIFMAFFQEFSLQIEADGYEPVSTETRPLQKGSQNFEIKLRQAFNLAGTVLSPDGQPVANAFVGLNGPDFTCSLIEGSRPSPGGVTPQTITDSNGRFSFKPKPGVESVLVVHELGSAQVPVHNLGKGPLVLQPWGAIEGKLIVGGKPLPDQEITLTAAHRDGAQAANCINAQANTKTDAEGRFRFPKVPSGPLVVCRFFNFNRNRVGPVGMSHSKEVIVPPGGTAEVTIGGNGRTVTGKLALSADLPGHDWRDDLQSLVQKGPKPPAFTPTADFDVIQRFQRELERYNASVQKYFLEIQPDGSFRIEDVPAGAYILELRVTQPIPSAAPSLSGPETLFNRRPLGKQSIAVTLPETDSTDLLDLGTITIPLDLAALARNASQFE